MPYNPRIVAPIISSRRYNLKALMNSGSTKFRDEMAVRATTIIMIGETIPALTAASPRISAPTIEMAELAKLGSLRSHSLKISKDTIISIHSMKAAKGTPSLWLAFLISNSKGLISWL